MRERRKKLKGLIINLHSMDQRGSSTNIKNFFRKTLGPIAIPSDVTFVKEIPKNKAGKPMRALIKAKSLGQPVGDTSVLANPAALEGIPKISIR